MIANDKKIFVSGHNGMVGSALVRLLTKNNFTVLTRSKDQLDLTQQSAVRDFMQTEKPDCVVVAAAKVGGIHANNSYPADFIYTNLMLECNLIHQAYEAGVQQLLFLGSSCIYPKFAQQPIAEASLLTGTLEATNEPYAIAKIAGIKLCESYNRQFGTDYRSVMPCNLYGPNDNFHLENSHVIPALIKKIHQAKVSGAPSVNVWGTGTARREFLHVDDLAAACLTFLQIPKNEFNEKVSPMCSHINIGQGIDISIADLAHLICKTIEFNGAIDFDTSKPDGTPQKLMDIHLASTFGWQPSYTLETGIAQTYEWFLANADSIRN
jgi:GDP-L-fucose synthase